MPSAWTSDDKLTFAYNADGGHETTYTAVVNSINNTLGSEVAATNPYPTSTITVPPCPIARFRAHSVAAAAGLSVRRKLPGGQLRFRRR